MDFIGITVLQLPGIEYIEPIDTPDLDVLPPPNYNFKTDFKTPTEAPQREHPDHYTAPKAGGNKLSRK